MVKKEGNKLFGLLGKNISYSFSREYFTHKFKDLGYTKHSYVNFDLQQIEDLAAVLVKNKEELSGINITIPYKQEVMSFLDLIDEDAEKIGAVNTIKFLADGKLKGFNTDFYGFKNSIQPFIKEHHKKALILGAGGASKAIAFAFEKMGIDYKFVSRKKRNKDVFTYEEITTEIIEGYTVIVNCTPLGTYPNIETRPEIPYEAITDQHLLYDLTYNPEETTFLKLGKNQGASIKNGFQMLELQAEKSWEIWNL